TKPGDSSTTTARTPMPYWALPAQATWVSTWCTSICIRRLARLTAVVVQERAQSASKSTSSPSYRDLCPPEESRAITARTRVHNLQARYDPTSETPVCWD